VIMEQSKRHGYILNLLGIKQVVVVINKMDLAGFNQDIFNKIKTDYEAFLGQINIHPHHFIPIAAKLGDNLVQRSTTMNWYQGPTILEALDGFLLVDEKENGPLRMPIQDVYKWDKRRILAGRVESGKICVGDEIIFKPSNKKIKIESIERWNAPGSTEATAGESIGITLSEQLFIERGEVLSHLENPVKAGSVFQANIFWMGEKHFVQNKKYILKLVTQEIECELMKINRVMNSSTLETLGRESHEVAQNEVAEVILVTKKKIAMDRFGKVPALGRFVIVDNLRTSGGGIILEDPDESYSDYSI